MVDLKDAALVILAIAGGLGLAAIVHFIADRRQRRKWRDLPPYITED